MMLSTMEMEPQKNQPHDRYQKKGKHHTDCCHNNILQ